MKAAAILLWISLLVCPAAHLPAAPSGAAAAAPVLMAHYMPWFEADAAAGRWGWHWTMNHYHPATIVRGRRELAAQNYPLLGLYDSQDPDVLECHVLLMKFAGIGGAFIDWYGTDNFLDYGINHRNTLSLVPYLKKAGLKFAVVYEDASVSTLAAAGRLPSAQVVEHGQALLRWTQAHWFTDPAYLKWNGQPVFLVFGAGYYQSDQWRQIFSVLPQPPAFFTERDRRAPAVGAFDWPQPGGGTADSLAQAEQFDESSEINKSSETGPRAIPAAFPGFHDIYAEAGVQKSWGRIDDRAGKTYEETLQKAYAGGFPIIQLVTWNDWGEGTQIEPSLETGYRELETTQRLRRRYARSDFPYTAQDLRLPVQLYTLRKSASGDPPRRAKLDRIAALLFAGHLENARTLLAALSLTHS